MSLTVVRTTGASCFPGTYSAGPVAIVRGIGWRVGRDNCFSDMGRGPFGFMNRLRDEGPSLLRIGHSGLPGSQLLKAAVGDPLTPTGRLYHSTCQQFHNTIGDMKQSTPPHTVRQSACKGGSGERFIVNNI